MMSVVIQLDPIPNQSLTVQLAGRRYVLAFKDAGGVMAVDVTRDDEIVVRGQRVVANTPLLPYRYLEDNSGNFMFVSTTDGMLPRWEDFGVETQLLYTSGPELEAIRNGAA